MLEKLRIIKILRSEIYVLFIFSKRFLIVVGIINQSEVIINHEIR